MKTLIAAFALLVSHSALSSDYRLGFDGQLSIIEINGDNKDRIFNSKDDSFVTVDKSFMIRALRFSAYSTEGKIFGAINDFALAFDVYHFFSSYSEVEFGLSGFFDTAEGCSEYRISTSYDKNMSAGNPVIVGIYMSLKNSYHLVLSIHSHPPTDGRTISPPSGCNDKENCTRYEGDTLYFRQLKNKFKDRITNRFHVLDLNTGNLYQFNDADYRTIKSKFAKRRIRLSIDEHLLWIKEKKNFKD